ncbi:response regulator, partial [Serratia marcescens]
ISKPPARRYLEYCVATQFVRVEMLYGNIGHPRRLYRKA